MTSPDCFWDVDTARAAIVMCSNPEEYIEDYTHKYWRIYNPDPGDNTAMYMHHLYTNLASPYTYEVGISATADSALSPSPTPASWTTSTNAYGITHQNNGPNWTQIEYSQAVNIKTLQLKTEFGFYGPDIWQLQASNDGTTWYDVVLSTEVDWVNWAMSNGRATLLIDIETKQTTTEFF